MRRCNDAIGVQGGCVCKMKDVGREMRDEIVYLVARLPGQKFEFYAISLIILL